MLASRLRRIENQSTQLSRGVYCRPYNFDRLESKIAARRYFSDYSGRRHLERTEIDWSDPRFSSREPSFAELYEAMLLEGCPICRLALRLTDRYIAVYCSDNVTDIDIRATMRTANGFCNTHAWQLPDQRDALGLAITYGDIITNLARQLAKADPQLRHSWMPRWLFGWLRRWRGRLNRTSVFAETKPCPACVEQWNGELRYAAALADHAEDAMLLERYRNGDGLCLPHARLVIAAAPDWAAVGLVAAAETVRWAELRSQLDEVVRKADYRFNHESITPLERVALTRVLAVASGARGLSAWRPPGS